MDISQTDHDGIKEVIVNISGDEVFGTQNLSLEHIVFRECPKLNLRKNYNSKNCCGTT